MNKINRVYTQEVLVVISLWIGPIFLEQWIIELTGENSWQNLQYPLLLLHQNLFITLLLGSKA